jgi:hypothetical protein
MVPLIVVDPPPEQEWMLHWMPVHPVPDDPDEPDEAVKVTPDEDD